MERFAGNLQWLVTTLVTAGVPVACGVGMTIAGRRIMRRAGEGNDGEP